MDSKYILNTTLASCILEVSSIFEQHQDCIKYNKERAAAFENLRNIDTNSIEALFEEMKNKLEIMKAKSISNYKTKYGLLLQKIQDYTDNLQAASETCASTLERLYDLRTNISKNATLGQFILPDTVEGMAIKAKVPIKRNYIDEELESLLIKEEIYSEIGSFSATLGNLESRLACYLNEHFSGFVTESNPTKVVKRDLVKTSSSLEPIKPRSTLLAENFEALLEESVECLDISRKPLLHQVRYASNQIYTFDLETQGFLNYELFTDSTYDTPFNIFHNSGSCVWKNQLVLLFGGEDPDQKSKTSNRVFCANISFKNEKNQLIVKEIPSMLFRRQEFSLATIGDSIYLISGYDMNLNKERRVISKCERLHIKSRRFYEIRDINYPRQWSSCISHNNSQLYVFAGQNPKYMNTFVDKVEKYMPHLNDWSVLKYTILDNFEYEPAIKMGIFKTAENEIAILGGERDDVTQKDYYIFDLKKNMFVKRKAKFLKDDDHFANCNDSALEENKILIFSGSFANRVYNIDASDKSNYNFALSIQQPLN